MSLYPARAVAPLMEEYSRFAVPAVYSASAASAAGPSVRSLPVPPSNTSPFSTSALAEQTPYRSMINSNGGAGFDERHSLETPNLNRAVDLQHSYAPEQQWFVQPTPAKSFDAFGAPQKQYTNSFLPTAALPTPALKELSMPRLEALALTRSVSLPVMPAYLESSCFSLAKAAMKPAEMMAHVQAHLKTAGVVVAERADRKLELDCQTSMGCSEFKVCCYGGHFSECGQAKPANSTAAAACYTVSFERTRGCSYAFLDLFQMLLCVLSQSGVPLDSQVAAAPPAAAAVEAPGEQSADAELIADLDLAMLPIPSLRASSVGAEPAAMMAPTASLFDSLHDLLSSRDPTSQVSGLHALALCLDGSQPEREAQLFCEVAGLLRDAQNESVRQVASMLISKASQMPGSAPTLIKTCLPACIASLIAATPLAANATALDSCLRRAGQACVLRACLRMVEAAPAEFNSALVGGDAGAMRASRLKRQLLLLSAPHTEDAELRQLAQEALKAIQM